MPKKSILITIYYLATLPIDLIGKILLALNVFKLQFHIEECLKVIDEKKSKIPDSYTPYLTAAEDHRSTCHFGIDQIGIIRALWKMAISSESQGASTIEQQLVRIVTGDYSHSIKRKFKEQLLAIFISKKRTKIDIAKAYLAVAYYGHNYKGAEGISQIVGENLLLASEIQIISIVARLKYPEPSVSITSWENKINRRISYIKNRHQKIMK